MRSAARTGGSSFASGGCTNAAEELVEPPLRAQRAVDEVGRERAVARAKLAAPQHLRQRRRCEYAPSSTRTSASQATANVRSAAFTARVERRSSVAVQARRAMRAPAIAALALGLHLVEHEPPVGGAERARAVDDARAGRDVAASASGVRPASTFTRRPPTIIHAPGRGLPAAHEAGELGGRALRVEAELVDRQLRRRRSARPPAASGCGRGERRAACRRAVACRARRGGRGARRRSRRSPIGVAHARVHGPGVETLVDAA